MPRKKHQPGCPCCNVCNTSVVVKAHHGVCDADCCDESHTVWVDASVTVKKAYYPGDGSTQIGDTVGTGTASGEAGVEIELPNLSGTYYVFVEYGGCEEFRVVTVAQCETLEVSIYLCCTTTCVPLIDYDTGAPVGEQCFSFSPSSTMLDASDCPCGQVVTKEGYWNGFTKLPMACFSTVTAPSAYMYSKANWVRLCRHSNCEEVNCTSDLCDQTRRRCDMLPRALWAKLSGPAGIFGDSAGVPVALTYDASTIGMEVNESGLFGIPPYYKCVHSWSACINSPGVRGYCRSQNPFIKTCFESEFGSAKVTFSVVSGGPDCSAMYATLQWRLYLGPDCIDTNANFKCGGPDGVYAYNFLNDWWCPGSENTCSCLFKPEGDCYGECYTNGVRFYPTQVNFSFGCPLPGCGPLRALAGPLDLSQSLTIGTPHPCCSQPVVTAEVFE